MDARSKNSKVRDNFLIDAVRPQHKGVTVRDGFRFGFGFVIAQLIVALIVGGIAWALVEAFHLHA